MDRERLARLGRAALPILAVTSMVIGIGATLASAGATLGYDFLAYRAAAERILAGHPIYDPAVEFVGAFGLYFYPPPFALVFVPFAWLPMDVAIWTWIALAVAMTIAAILILPVRPSVRWGIFLLAGLDWPVAYAIKLGQVGPLLLLAFALGWRLMRSESALGTVAAVGTIVKAQPGLLLGWALLTKRWRMLAVGLAIGGMIVLVTLPVLGVSAWTGYFETLGRVSSPVTTPKTLTMGALAFQAGASLELSTIIQVASIGATVVAWLLISRFRGAEVGFLTTIVASQLLSPLLWEHYAMLLLLPVAWLLERRLWWAVLIPLVTSIPLLAVVPSVVYPVVFFVCLVAPALVAPRAIEN